eukprot:6479421-Amphidinium_carterae.1
MDPSAEELEEIGKSAAPLTAAIAWTGLSDVVLTAIRDETGAFSKVRELIFMPLAQWKIAIEAARVTTEEGPRALLPLEVSQAHMLRRVARCLCDLDPNEGDGLG